VNAEPPSEPAVVASRFLAAFSASDFERMRALLADDLVAYVTTAEGGMDRLEGRDEYLARLEAMDLPAARFSVEPTQPPVAVDADRVLVMVEVHAQRAGRSLHNFAAHLLRIADGRISDWRMVDAKPSESDEFWS
jgi:ketosteroid isomerase-like protein